MAEISKNGVGLHPTSLFNSFFISGMSMLLNVTHQGFSVKEFKIIAIATISNFSNVHHAPASSYLQLVWCATRNTCNSSDKGVILATHQIRV